MTPLHAQTCLQTAPDWLKPNSGLITLLVGSSAYLRINCSIALIRDGHGVRSGGILPNLNLFIQQGTWGLTLSVHCAGLVGDESDRRRTPASAGVLPSHPICCPQPESALEPAGTSTLAPLFATTTRGTRSGCSRLSANSSRSGNLSTASSSSQPVTAVTGYLALGINVPTGRRRRVW